MITCAGSGWTWHKVPRPARPRGGEETPHFKDHTHSRRCCQPTLTRLDNVTLIPHLGYVVEESYRHFYEGTVKDIEAWLDGTPINVLNPDALKKA